MVGESTYLGHLDPPEKICNISSQEPIRSITELNIEGSRGQRRPKKRWSDCVKEDLNEKGLTSDMTRDRSYWRTRIRAADPGTVWD